MHTRPIAADYKGDGSRQDYVSDLEAYTTNLEQALWRIARIRNRHNCGDWDEIDDARRIARVALNLPAKES